MNKKSIVFTLLAFLLSCLVVFIGRNPYTTYAKILGVNTYKGAPVELYRVYLAGENLGVIKSKSELENYIDIKQNMLKEKYNVDKVYAPSDLKIVKELTYNEKASTVDEIYKKIDKQKGSSYFTINGYTIEIEGIEKKFEEDGEIKKKQDIVFYVIDKSIFEHAVDTTITAFVDGEEYQAYLNNTQKEIKDNETGKIIESLQIQNNVKIKKGRIPADDSGNIFTSSEELSKFLLFGTTKEQEKYAVQSGDSIESIANANKLSIQEFLIANDTFTSADDLLYPGQVVNIGAVVPQFDLEEVDTVVSEKTIAKDIVYKNDDTKYVGYEEVEEQGSDGLALVTESRKIVNGTIQDTINVGSVELIPAVNKVVVRGTKQYQYSNTGTEWVVPVGIGSWVWPTNVPYTISSGFGWRWGKLHEGIDIGGTGYGSPIKAANNGIVIQSGYTGTNGNYIVIKHANDYYTMYAHLASRYKQVGNVVMAGDQIGTMGMTGFATGVHLHFGLYRGYPYRGGIPTNPFTLYN